MRTAAAFVPRGSSATSMLLSQMNEALLKTPVSSAADDLEPSSNWYLWRMRSSRLGSDESSAGAALSLSLSSVMVGREGALVDMILFGIEKGAVFYFFIFLFLEMRVGRLFNWW